MHKSKVTNGRSNASAIQKENFITEERNTGGNCMQVMEETTRNEKKVYEASDIMEILGIGRSKAYEFLRDVCDSDTPPFQVIKIGRLVRVPKKSFDEWLDRAYGGAV